MPPRNRSGGRNVHIYNVKDPATPLGGLILTNGVTNANFYSMVEILVLFAGSFELRNEEDDKIEKNDDALSPGKYYIHALGKLAGITIAKLILALRSFLNQ
jgi:hypothetical protein